MSSSRRSRQAGPVQISDGSYSWSPRTVTHRQSALHWTLVDDGVIPDGFIALHFPMSWGGGSCTPSQSYFPGQCTRRTSSYITSTRVGRGRRKQRQTFKTRLERTLFLWSDTVERCRGSGKIALIHDLATLLMDTPTPVGQMLRSNPSDSQFIGADCRPSTLRALVRYVKNLLKWLTSAHQKPIPLKVSDLTSFLKFVATNRVTAGRSEMSGGFSSSWRR